ncbi:MAG: hypothetical protein K5906_00610 [Bacilli bacterium]|nr:hypothetical protein [Bacilli bacterium]
MKINKKKLASNIAFYLVLAIIYTIAIFAVVTKFTGGTIYLFNNRVDVILTDSMSTVNEHHAEYLKDTKQIQPFDMVVSTTINDQTELKEKDCVLFKNPDLKNETVVHRIVHIYEEGIAFNVINATKTTFNNEDVFALDAISGKVTLEPTEYNSVTVNAYSKKESKYYYQILEGKNVKESKCETTKISDEIYKHTITYTRTSRAPYYLSILPATDEEIYISSIVYGTYSLGDFSFNASELVLDESNCYEKLFNSYYLYEIRADKSATSDGIFERSALISKVNTVIPKLGHVVHFIQSIPGLIMLVGLAVIITVASFLLDKKKKDEKAAIEEKPAEPKDNENSQK